MSEGWCLVVKQSLFLWLVCHALGMLECALSQPQSCTTPNNELGQCVPEVECQEQAHLIDLRSTGACSDPSYCCTPLKSPWTECDSGKGYCVGSHVCTVRTFRLRSNRCPSFRDVCCPKLAIADQSPTTTTESTTTTETVTAVEKSAEKITKSKTNYNRPDRPPEGEENVSGMAGNPIITSTKHPAHDFIFPIETGTPAAKVLTSTKTPDLSLVETSSKATSTAAANKNVSTTPKIVETPTTVNSEDSSELDDFRATTIGKTNEIVSSTIRINATASWDEFEPSSTKPPTGTTSEAVGDIVPNLLPMFALGKFAYEHCGQRNRWGVVESTHDEDNHAEYGEYPWTAALFQVNRGTAQKRYCCNGALVSENAVLTTAHCVDRCGLLAATMEVRLGEWIMSSTTEPIPPEDVGVKLVHKHPNFHPSSLINNIAVLELHQPVQYKATIQPICLPSENDFENQLRTAENMFATGWGATVNQTLKGVKTGSDVLKRLDLQHEGFVLCEEKLKRSVKPSRFTLHSSFVCSNTYHDERPCDGDAGAPVVVEKRGTVDQFYVYGLVSWGERCDQTAKRHTVLTRVAKFRDWIKEFL